METASWGNILEFVTSAWVSLKHLSHCSRRFDRGTNRMLRNSSQKQYRLCQHDRSITVLFRDILSTWNRRPQMSICLRHTCCPRYASSSNTTAMFLSIHDKFCRYFASSIAVITASRHMTSRTESRAFQTVRNEKHKNKQNIAWCIQLSRQLFDEFKTNIKMSCLKD
jgi:hypothetical protein